MSCNANTTQIAEWRRTHRRSSTTRRHEPRRVRRQRPSDPPPPWRREIVILSGLNATVGVWLLIAPWVLAYGERDSKWNDVTCGVIVAALAATRGRRCLPRGLSELDYALCGAWLAIAALTIDYPSAARWNDLIAGLAVLLLWTGSATATGDLIPPRKR